MTKYLVASGRNYFTGIADLLSFELEDTLIDCLSADLYCLQENPAKSELSVIDYDAIFIVTNNFRQLSESVDLLNKAKITSRVKCGYVFGGYAYTVERYFRPLRRKLLTSYKFLKQVDYIFTGIQQDIAELTEGLQINVQYIPMAADVLKIAANPDDPRPITINGFGRQEINISNMIADTFNKPGSNYLYYHTNFLAFSSATDWVRYREMFWQVLRQSKLSLAFDSLFYNPSNNSRHSFVGPRWYESLGAGNVVIGIAPNTPDKETLLNWENATIELPANPSAAVEKIISLLEQPNFIKKIIRANLIEMNQRHDWRYRIVEILKIINMETTPQLTSQLKLLQQRAHDFQTSNTNETPD